MAEQFIQRAHEKHGCVYDYSKVQYTHRRTKIIIVCKHHGEFEQTPEGHLSGRGCYPCGRITASQNKRKTTAEFVKRATHKHGNTFDYSKCIYVKGSVPILITCKSHGDFLQLPTKHLKGTLCCPTCVTNAMGKWNSSNTMDFVLKAGVIHGDIYDYSKVDYISATRKIILICKQHGEFTISPNSHLNGSGCSLCGKQNSSIKQRFSLDDFKLKSQQIHGNKYDYSNVHYINNNTKISIICRVHGEFEQTPAGHLTGRGCSRCSLKHSYTTEEWIQMAKNVHGDTYDYSKSIYISANDNIHIGCRVHGGFEQKPTVHLRPTGCCKCNPKKFSRRQIEWLQFISIYYDITIQHAMNGQEYHIPTTKYKADGYCEATNTVYEFHGDLWHGNPKKYNPNDTSYFGIQYGELYERTLQREQEIKTLGYNLIVMWEYDWNIIRRIVILLQRRFRNKRVYKVY
jgi:hypothetical protein